MADKKYHINPEKKIGLCRAQEGNCRFGSDQPHFDKEQDAFDHLLANDPEMKDIYEQRFDGLRKVSKERADKDWIKGSRLSVRDDVKMSVPGKIFMDSITKIQNAYIDLRVRMKQRKIESVEAQNQRVAARLEDFKESVAINPDKIELVHREMETKLANEAQIEDKKKSDRLSFMADTLDTMVEPWAPLFGLEPRESPASRKNSASGYGKASASEPRRSSWDDPYGEPKGFYDY